MIRYEGNISYTDILRADLSAGMLFGSLKFKLLYGETLDGGLYLLGHRVKTLEQIADRLKKASDGTDNEPSEEEKSEDGKSAEEESAEGKPVEGKSEPVQMTDDPDSSDPISKKKETLRKLWNAAVSAGKRAKRIWSMLTEPSDKRLQKIKADVFRSFLREILPRRMSGDIKIGLDDPYYTGKVLEVLTLIYAAAGDALRVEPVWDGFCLRGNLEFEGRIHITVILWGILRLLNNAQFRKIWRENNVK